MFPCQPGRKIPGTRHGHLDASTDEQQITAWFGRDNGWNLAVAAGARGPDVSDIDCRGPAGNGFGALARLRTTGLLDGAAGYVRTPGGGLHGYFAGTRQRNSHLPAHHLDFRSAGGHVLVPPSMVGGRPHQPLGTPNGQGRFDWAAATRLLEGCCGTAIRSTGPMRCWPGLRDRVLSADVRVGWPGHRSWPSWR